MQILYQYTHTHTNFRLVFAYIPSAFPCLWVPWPGSSLAKSFHTVPVLRSFLIFCSASINNDFKLS